MMDGLKLKFGKIDMTEGRPWRKLMIFAVPLLVGNIFQQFYNMADAMILGQFVGPNALAAVGASMPVFFLIIVLMAGIAIGGGVMVSQYFGAKSREDLSRTIGTIITTTAILGGFLMIIGPMFSRPLMELLNTPAEIIDDSVLYMNILMWGILGLAYFNIFSGILRGLGDSFSPLIYLVIASLLNVALNFLFVVGFGWGMPAVAIGTVVSQGLSALLCWFKLLKMRHVFDADKKYLKPQRKYVSQVLKLGVPTGLSQAVIAVAVMMVQPLTNSFGASYVATMTIIMRIDAFIIMPIFSFGNAITVYAGQNMGAGKKERISQGVREGAILSVVVSVAMGAAVLLFSETFARMFTNADYWNTPYVIDMTVRMLRILVPGFIIFSVCQVLWGAIRGAGDAISPMWGSLINTVVIRVPTAYLFYHLMTTPDWLLALPTYIPHHETGEMMRLIHENAYGRAPEALMWSLVAAWVTNTVISIIVYRMGKWRNKSIVKQDISE
ncbi:MAG: MATE family efflux transporter [Defluviitaleaceae bacterium]|nr:MATE family efflux transporter [Defluviitaleaceae bacterium]